MFGRTIEEVYSAEAALELTASDRRRQLAELKKEIGGLLLDDPEQESTLTEKLIRATMQVDVDRGKIEASRARRRRMVEDGRRKRAAELRTKAERDREESESIVKRVNAQLQKIAEIEGVAQYDVTVLQHHSEVARHVQLLSDAETAEAQARDLEQPAVFDKPGRVTGGSAVELWQKAGTDPRLMKPTLEAIEEWVAIKHEKAVQKFGKLHVDGRGLVFLLPYRGGEIGDSGLPMRIDDQDVALGPMTAAPSDPGAGYRARGFADPYTTWRNDRAYAADGSGSMPRPGPPEAA